MTDWLLIETAPKDGTPILAYLGEDREPEQRVLRWGAFPKLFYLISWTDGLMHSYQPTHWRHLPPPP